MSCNQLSMVCIAKRSQSSFLADTESYVHHQDQDNQAPIPADDLEDDVDDEEAQLLPRAASSVVATDADANDNAIVPTPKTNNNNDSNHNDDIDDNDNDNDNDKTEVDEVGMNVQDYRCLAEPDPSSPPRPHRTSEQVSLCIVVGLVLLEAFYRSTHKRKKSWL